MVFGDVMIFAVVNFAAEVHHNVTLYKKITQHNLDAS